MFILKLRLLAIDSPGYNPSELLLVLALKLRCPTTDSSGDKPSNELFLELFALILRLTTVSLELLPVTLE